MRRGRGAAARIARISAWTLAALVALVLVVTVGVPLVVRGPVLAGVVAHASKKLCGSLKVTGGHVSVGVALALLRQRPFEVVIEGVDLKTPGGEDIFHAGTVRTKVTVQRRPWRLVFDDGLIADGKWQLIDEGFGDPLMATIQPVPDGGRAQCGAPEPPKRHGPQQQGDLVTIKSLALRNVTLVLSFDDWAVTLASIDAVGGLSVRGKGPRRQILFDVTGVRAEHGGSLRIGPAGHRLTPQVPFDRVAIGRVAVVAGAPGNLLLEVDEGRTGQAVLSGKAVFTNILGPRDRPPAGMDIDARYTAVGQALARNPAWADVAARLVHLNAGLEVSLHGPFNALTGTAALIGNGVALNAGLLPDRHYEADVRFDALDTAPLVPASQRDLLGGRLDGRIAVSAKLGSKAIDTSASVDRLELDLVRSRRAPGPRRIVISRAEGPSSADELRIGLGVISLRREVLRVASLRARGPGVQLGLSLRADREPSSAAFRFRAEVDPASQVAIFGETFALPPLVSVRFEPGRAVAVQPLSIERVGGGAIDAGGSLRLDGQGDLRVAVRGYPLAHIPGVAGVRAPGQAAPLARVLRGQLDASFRLVGSIAQPRLSGELATTGVRWAGRQLGDGRIVLHGIADGTRFEGALIDGVDVSGQLRRHARRDDFVSVSLRDVRLGSWLPQPAAALGLRASGNVVVTAPGRAPRTTATGDVSISGSGVALKVAARLRPERGTASVNGRVDLGRVDVGLLKAKLPALRIRNVAGVITADVSWQAAADATGNGSGLWPYARYPKALAGVDGTIAVVDGLSVASARLRAAITVPPTKIELGGDAVRVPGLEVRAGDAYAKVAGRVHHIDWSHPQDGTLEAEVSATVDGRGLGRWLGDGATSGGTARVVAQLTGAVRAPRVTGQANFDDLRVSWPRSPVGTVNVNGPVAIDGRKLAVGPLVVRTGNGGWLKIAGPQGAGHLTVAPGRAPLPFDDVDVTVQGRGLGTTRPVSGLSVKDLALGLRLAEDVDHRLRLTGEVRLGPTVFDFRQQRKDADAEGAKQHKAAPAKRPADRPSPLDRVTLDVRLTGPDDAVEVRVPFVPNVTVGLDCRVQGTLASPHLGGEVRGSGAYSRAALTTADRFTERELRKCDLGPR